MEKKIKILILEDEAILADQLAYSLEELGYEVVGVVNNGAALLEELEAKSPHLVLLDIQVKGSLDGIDVAHIINQRFQIPFLFLTSYTNNSIIERATMTSPAGFITKPYLAKNLKANIDIALFKEKATASEESLPFKGNFFIREKSTFIKIPFDAILYIKAMDNYSQIITQNGNHLLSQTLKKIEQKLTLSNFVRAHRSYIINIDHLTALYPREVLIGEYKIPITKETYQELQKIMELL